MKVAVYFFRVAMLSSFMINVSFHSDMSYELYRVTYALSGVFLLGFFVFEAINYTKNRRTFSLRKSEWKYTKFAQNAIPAFFLIWLFSNLFIAAKTWLIHSILLYGLWFSFGLLLGSLLINHTIRKDMDNIRKQIEEREKRERKEEVENCEHRSRAILSRGSLG